MKRYLCLLLAILMLCGCAAAPAETTSAPTETTSVPRETYFGWALKDEYRRNGIEMEDFSDNLDYKYIKWSYCGWYHFDPTPEEQEQGIRSDDWCSNWNLTMTARKEQGSSYIRGTMVLESLDDYNAVMNAIAATKASALQNCGAYQEPEVIQQTWNSGFDEAFFENNVLVLIDHCYEGHTFLRSRLDSITREPGRATVKLSWETVHAYTADQPGEVYWIILPRHVGNVTVEYTETAWN